MKVSVFGLGYVGAVSCGCFAKDGHRVIGVDINQDKVQLINEGKSPIIEEQIGEIIAEAVQVGYLKATSDIKSAVLESEVSVISVGTPSQSNGSLSLVAIERVCDEIGQALKEKSDRHLIVVRSTVLPGTVRKIVIPRLEAASGKICNEDFGVLFNPEFLREGSSVKDHYNPPLILLGCEQESDAQRAAMLYEKVDAEVFFSELESAEMMKYVCNTFHALKVTFANEMGILCQSLGCDSHAVMDLVCKDTKLNISPAYMKPGFAFGGSCLPKDVKALCSVARERDLVAPLLNSILDSNKRQIDRAINEILAIGKKSIAILGLSFKSGTDDLRESPMVQIAEVLIGKGFSVNIYDQNVSLARLTGANKEYIEREIVHISSLMTTSLASAVENADILLIGNGAPEFHSRLPLLIKSSHTVIDLVNIGTLKAASTENYRGITW